MGANKVSFNTPNGEQVIIDLTGDNVTPDSIVVGHTAHGADGELVQGANPYELEATNVEVGSQAALIAQIAQVLEGKAAGGSGKPEQEKTVEITENGEHTITPDDGYTLSNVTVNLNVPDTPAVVDVLEVTENGAYNAADEGLDGFSVVTVNVPSSGGGETEAYGFLNNTITDIDSGVTSVVGYACRGLSKLKTVKLPNATSIGTYAFYYCTAMTSINAPKVTSLGTYAFYNCSKLVSINFPLATAIPTYCFYSCGAVKKADFGAAKSIAASCFAYCSALEALILRRADAICTLANTTNALKDTPIENGTGYVYVPAALVDTYKAASNWSTYANQFRAIEDYPEICGTEV